MSLSVRDVLLLPVLQPLRLRAGEANVQRVVRWPYVVENHSIADWVLGGELVFVTGINQHRDEANLVQLVREADERACAGLVILTGSDYIDEIPAGVLAVADELGLPLIEQPYALPLVVVTEAIGSALVQAQLLGSSRQRLIEQLLDGNLADTRVLAHRAAGLEVDLSLPRQVLVLEPTDSAALYQEAEPAAAELALQNFRQRVLQYLTRNLDALGHPLPVIHQGDQWIVLLPLEADAAASGHRSKVERWMQALDAPAPLKLLAGLSAPCPQAIDLPRGLGQARQALMAARAMPERAGLCCFEELGLLELLTAIPDRNLLDRFVQATLGPVLRNDKAHRAVLIHTLEAWIQSNGNIAAAANRLGLHRNTLNHRMRQIQDLLPHDLDDPQQRLAIAIALMILRLSPHTP